MWFIGAALAVLGSVCSNLGVNTQKYSFMKNAKLGAKAKTSYCKQPLWLFGLFLVIAGSLGDFAALAFAAQSIVAPIGSVTLVANLFFAHFWLHEKLSRRDLFGTFLIIGGSTMAVAFGDHSSKTYTIHELKELYKGTLFLTYGSVIVVLGSICYVVAKKLEPKKKMLVAAIYRYDEAFNKGDEAEIIAQDSIIADLEAAYQPYEKVHPFSYCALSGMLGANSILFGKMVAELIALTFAGDNQMINPLTYVFLFCMFVTIFAQLHFLALALQHFDALYVVPVFQCFFITVSTVGGACFFLEFSEFQVIQMCMFPIGITVTLTGVYLLSARKMDQGIKRMNEEETRAHCEKKQAEREQNERSDSTDDSEGSRENNGGLTPCTQAIKRQVNGQDDIPEMHITVDVAHRQQSMIDVTEHQRVSTSDSQGNPIEMNPLHSRGKYQVPPLGLHSAKNSTYLSASPHQHARTVSQRLHGAMVPNAVGHGVLMVVGADHVDEVTPNVKDEITMNDGTVVVVTSRYARKSLNRAPNSTSPDETPRSSIIRTYGGASQHGSPVQSKHTSPIGSPHTTPKSRARSILAVYQSAYNTAVIGSTPLHQADRRLPPPLPTAFLQSHGLHVANPNHARSTSTLISPQIAAALSQHHSPAHTINIASTGGRTTPRASMIHVANVASVVAARTSLSKPRFSLTKATSILPNVDTKQAYQPVPGDDTPRHTVDVMPSMAEGTETPKIRTHTVTHSDDSNSGNGGAYVHLPSPSQSACPSPSAMTSTDPALAPPSYSKAFSLSMTPSSTQPLIMRTSSEDDPFYTQASVNEFATQPSLSLQLSLPDPPSQIGVSPGLSSLLKDDRSSSDADAITPISSTTIQQALNSSPPHPHPRHHHKRTRSSLIPTQPIDPDDPVEIEVDTHTRRISLEPIEKEALARAEALRQTTHVNTTINSRSRPTSMTHITLDTTSSSIPITTVPRQPTLTSKRVTGGILSSAHPSRVRLNLHGSHAELVPAPATTTALAVAIATATSQPTHPRRRSAYAQQKDAAMMVIPSTVVTHGRRASMDRTTVVPLHSPPSSSPSSAHVPVRRISPRMEQLSAPFRARPMDINTVVRDTSTPLVSPSGVSVNMASSLIDTPTSSSRDPSPRQPVGVTTNKSKPPPTSKNAW